LAERRAGSHEERWEWVEHLVPLQFLRALWDALFPKRFERVVVDALDGTPAPGYARPLTFCLGCWLLLYAVGKTTPWAFSGTGIVTVLRELPPAERHAVAAQLGIDTLAGVIVVDSGSVPIARGARLVIAHVDKVLGKPFGRASASDVAQYLEKNHQLDLAIRVRGYVARYEERPTPFSETSLVMFVVFGLVPGWWVSHLILHSRRRTLRETRYVHMYNDSLLVVWCLAPFFVATWAGEAFATAGPQHVLTVVVLAGAAYWLWRTVRLFRLTHAVPVWRIAAAHVAGVTVAFIMCLVFSFGAGILRGTMARAGF